MAPTNTRVETVAETSILSVAEERGMQACIVAQQAAMTTKACSKSSTKFWSEEIKLSYDDVELVPSFSDIHSREHISLDAEIVRGVSIRLPFVVSPMDTAATKSVLRRIHQLGGLGFVYRAPIKEQINILDYIKAGLDKHPDATQNLAVSVGLDFEHKDIRDLEKAGAKIILINVAHGFHKRVAEAIQRIKEASAYVKVIAGNISTAPAAAFLIANGADGIRVGIAQGSMCTTAVKTGHGFPMISSLLECWEVAKIAGVPVIADGGIRNSGDMVKALASGADTVMMGRLFAQTVEAYLDKRHSFDGDSSRCTVYRGEASHSYKMAHGMPGKNIEGEECLVPVNGTVEEEVSSWSDGVRSGLSYSGSYTIKELHRRSKFIIITPNGLEQARAHGKLYKD